MNLEQRIGRVDRIGQTHVVRTVNFALHDTVEYQVREVLETKLAIMPLPEMTPIIVGIVRGMG